jgi:hypothetical protein
MRARQLSLRQAEQFVARMRKLGVLQFTVGDFACVIKGDIELTPRIGFGADDASLADLEEDRAAKRKRG